MINALLGLTLFEIAWAATKRHRTLDQERDKLFPSWRRNDAKNWNKLKLYPIALTIMPLKVFLHVLILILAFIAHKVIFFGSDLNKPMTPL